MKFIQNILAKQLMKLKSALERDNFMTADVAKSFWSYRRSSRKKILIHNYILTNFIQNLINISLL